jgi:hypothetical protein
MSGAADLAERIAETLRQRATNDQMTSVGLRAGVVIPAYEEGVSKRDRARQGIAGKTERELGEIARLLGIQFSDYALEEAGLAVLEHGTAAITVITRRDVAKCFGDDLCGEQDVVEIVRKLFPIDTMGAEFFSSRSLSHNIEQHMIRNPGDWSVEFLFDQIGAFTCSRDRFNRLIEAALHPMKSTALVPTSLSERVQEH